MTTGLRKEIIDTALILFEKKGFHGVSINEIVTKANTSKGGFYHHFSSKDELLFVIHDMFITYAIESVEEAVETYERPIEQLQGVIKRFVHVFDLYKPHLSVFYQEAIYLQPEYEAIIKKKRKKFRKILERLMHTGKKQGEFRQDLEVDIVVMGILGMVNWIHKWYDETGEKSIEQIASIFTDFILRAVVVEK